MPTEISLIKKMIDFNKAPLTGNEIEYINEALESRRLCGDGPFGKKCQEILSEKTDASSTLLVPSGTAALEMAAILSDIEPGDEVILPSYTFCSTANAFVLRGAKLVFVDIRPDTMNIDENKIEEAITDRTKAIAVVHYAGVSCEMDKIKDIAKKYDLALIEDAAQALGSTYKDMPLGTIGDMGCLSFHETKNLSMGEGGALLLPKDADESLLERAEILREKGTDRSKFFRGQIDKYTWRDFGSSYLPSELASAYLFAQLEKYDEIMNDRMNTWTEYNEAFSELAKSGRIELPYIPDYATHNAHMFYIKLADIKDRTQFISKMRDAGILCVFHYIPLHSSPAGIKYGRFHGEDVYTTKESERLVRLPLYYGLSKENRDYIIEKTLEYLA